MATRHNTCTNPACSVANTGWTGGATPTRVTGLSGFVVTTGARYTSGTFAQLPVGAASPGLQYTGSVYIRPNGGSIGGGTLYLAFTRSAGGDDFSNTVALGTVATDTVTRKSITVTAPANTTGAYLIIDGVNFGAVGTGTDITACLIEESASAGIYFDGDSPGATWDGTTGLSASTLIDTIALVVADASQAQTVDALALTQVHALTVADTAQAQAVDSVTLTQVHVLTVADAVQSQMADNVTLTQVHQLGIQSARQALRSDIIGSLVPDAGTVQGGVTAFAELVGSVSATTVSLVGIIE